MAEGSRAGPRTKDQGPRTKDQRLADIASRSGQVTLEFFLLFAVVAVATIVGITSFDDDVASRIRGVVTATSEKMVACDGYADAKGVAKRDPCCPPIDETRCPQPKAK